MRHTITRWIRRWIPSTAKLSYSSLFRIIGNPFASIANIYFPEFRQLPPNHLRVRVGVGNRLFNNHVLHWRLGEQFWLDWLSKGWCTSSSDIVEIGCGCGRIAQHLDADWFNGTYIGVDIDREMIEWCESRFKEPKFRFMHSPHASSTYSPGSGVAGNARFTFGEIQSKDFVFSTSLLTHLLEGELNNYLLESARVLRSGGYMYMTFFSMQHVEKGGRWTFSHRIGNAYVENLRLPEAAVAYDNDYILEAARNAGFSSAFVIANKAQSQLVARK